MPTSARVRLLRLADDVAGEDAELGDPLAQQRLGVVVDALAHALVDAADGRVGPTQALPWPPRSERLRRAPAGASRPTGGDDPASCSALAARLRRLHEALADPVEGADPAHTPLLDRVRRAVDVLAGALQEHVVALACATSAADRADADRAVLRGLRTAYLLLQPDGAAPARRRTGPGALPLPHDHEDHRDHRAPGHP